MPRLLRGPNGSDNERLTKSGRGGINGIDFDKLASA
jgi:hypothetical protein